MPVTVSLFQVTMEINVESYKKKQEGACIT